LEAKRTRIAAEINKRERELNQALQQMERNKQEEARIAEGRKRLNGTLLLKSTVSIPKRSRGSL